jgi:predicted transcriptional regulator YheO
MVRRTRAQGAKFRPYVGIGEAVANLFHPFAEVVIHDIETESIAHIWNSFTGRCAGEPSNLEQAPDLFGQGQNLLGPYVKSLAGGGRTKSMTTALFAEDGTKFGYFCINVDVSVADEAITRLSAFTEVLTRRPDPLYRNDLQEHISFLVRDFVRDANKPLSSFDRAEKIALVAAINKSGIFQARNAIKAVAATLGISRGSVYNLLTESRSAPDDH